MPGRRQPRRAGESLELFDAAPDAGQGARREPITAQPAVSEPESEFVNFGEYPGESMRSAISVSMLTQTAKDVIEGAFIPLWVRGEVSDFKSHRNGHWYFCLRDGTAQIRSVVWKRDQRGIPASPDDGMQVVAFGRLTVYAARGEMQFTVAKIEAEGDGLRRKALEITRARLEADGLLAPERKRALPRFPRVIAVVTSPDGAALHDIVAVVRRRGANVRLVVVPAAVQGESAPEELCYALDQVNRWGGADLVIVGRGGGAREDLWAFNDERVARAVAACRVPIISAVGHEVDVSICDLVADHRAATPSAAAEAATRSRAELTSELRKLSFRFSAGARGVLRDRSVAAKRAARDVRAAAQQQLARRQSALGAVSGRLHALSPLATLARGYAVARGANGATLASASDFGADMPFELVVRDGVVLARANPGKPA
ncbi:MAG TPA: exodeoxyribonuclease VII large subunit [Gemmatimonadaceae bacterium]|nr:exodeoxyribonuclease VII large subunit [Gemmatimonadaceae bacterium]